MFKKMIFVCFLILGCYSYSFAEDITLKWDENTDADLKGYYLYQSNQPGVYVKGPDHAVSNILAGNSEVTITNIPDGTWFWVLTSFDNYDNESDFSNEVTKIIDTTPPNNPTGLTIVN